MEDMDILDPYRKYANGILIPIIFSYLVQKCHSNVDSKGSNIILILPTNNAGEYIIPADAFEKNRDIDIAIIDKTVECLNRAIFNHSSIKYAIIPPSIKRIDDATFWGCDELIEVISSVKSISECAFDGCYNLRKVSLFNKEYTLEQCPKSNSLKEVERISQEENGNKILALHCPCPFHKLVCDELEQTWAMLD